MFILFCINLEFNFHRFADNLINAAYSSYEEKNNTDFSATRLDA